MHYFSVESNERIKVFSTVSFISIFLSWALNKVCYLFSLEIPWWIDAPSVIGFFTFLIIAFNLVFWKVEWIKKIFGIATPNISGSWKGYFKTGYENYETEIPASLEIEQNWMKILIEFKTSSSTSKSMSANIVKRSGIFEILYSYDNYPKGGQTETLVPHKGFVIANYDPNRGIIEGQYFTDPHRKNNGIFEFSK